MVGSRRPTPGPPGPPGPVKVARLLRPSRGKGAATQADHQGAAASLSAPPEKKKAAESRAASSSSVGSDPVREAATQTAQEKLRTPSKVSEVLVQTKYNRTQQQQNSLQSQIQNRS